MARWRRGWGKKGNIYETMVNEWYENCICYTLITAAGIRGFIPFACHTVVCYKICNESVAGTVDSEYFLYWVKNYLCPTLGNFKLETKANGAHEQCQHTYVP